MCPEHRSKEPLMKVEHVKKIYKTKKGDILAVRDISFDVYKGEIVSIVGCSGCGKSTTLNMLTGLLPLTEGKIFLDGKEVKGPQPKIGMVFQNPVLPRWRNVIENVLLPIEILNLDKEAYRKKAMDLLNLVGLRGFEDKYPRELSGGMQQRAAICRALIHDPDILVMDEPFGSLDALTRDFMNEELMRIWNETRKTIIYVTHYIPEAVFLSHRVVALTPRPSSVSKIIDIDFPHPRKSGIKTTKKFGDYIEEIHEAIGA